jgi:hypothetical protein
MCAYRDEFIFLRRAGLCRRASKRMSPQPTSLNSLKGERMRNHAADYSDYDDTDFDEPRVSRGLDGLQTLALLGALALIAAPAFKSFSRRMRARQPAALGEPAIDKSLKDTFPASDPPASRYFDIPENRK